MPDAETASSVVVAVMVAVAESILSLADGIENCSSDNDRFVQHAFRAHALDLDHENITAVKVIVCIRSPRK